MTLTAAEDAVEAILAAHDSETEVRVTERQRQVLRLVACGLSNLEIGQRLFLAEDTVKTILRLMFRELGARNRAHAVAIGFRAGWIRPGDVMGGPR